MVKLLIVLVVLLASGILFFELKQDARTAVTQTIIKKEQVTYMPLGDSYTIGQGVDPKGTWPSMLVSHLQSQGTVITIIGNPARTGFTTKDVIEQELPLFETKKPTFATLLIGVNDWVQGVPADQFRTNVVTILDRMEKTLPENRIVIVTIPDFSATPTAVVYSNGRNITQGISEFNAILKDEARKRNIPVADIFVVSQGMSQDSSLIASDNLHPSEKEYQLWEPIIFEKVSPLLK